MDVSVIGGRIIGSMVVMSIAGVENVVDFFYFIST
jgi:hypothetical protein